MWSFLGQFELIPVSNTTWSSVALSSSSSMVTSYSAIAALPKCTTDRRAREAAVSLYMDKAVYHILWLYVVKAIPNSFMDMQSISVSSQRWNACTHCNLSVLCATYVCKLYRGKLDLQVSTEYFNDSCYIILLCRELSSEQVHHVGTCLN